MFCAFYFLVSLYFLFIYFFFSLLEICLNFYGLVKASYGHKSFAIGFNFVLILLITIGHTKSILSIFFLGGKITDMVNTTSFQLKFSIWEDLSFSTYIYLEALFFWNLSFDYTQSVSKLKLLICKKGPESLFKTALVQLLYHLLNVCSYS